MFKNLTRRKRYLVIASILGASFIVVLIAVFWLSAPSKDTYVPGEAIEGLTDDLGRTIPEDYPRVTFTDVSAQAGIRFKHFSGQRTTQLPEDMGSGVAWGDFDNDGWPDLFVANQAGPITMTPAEMADSPARSALYHNNQDGTFSEVSEQSGIRLVGQAHAAGWEDYDRDGQLDLFVSGYGKNHLFRNKGNGTFEEVASMAGIDLPTGYWTGIAWGDYNLDGYSDLYVCGYVKYELTDPENISLQNQAEVPSSLNPSSFSPERNLLFKNNKDGTFSEVAVAAGVENLNGRSLAAAWCDLDEDGWPDLYVANDVSDNVLFRNLKDGTFEDVSHASLVADYRGAMGIAISDWDNDADLDMFITHWIAQENALYNNLKSQLGQSVTNSLRFMDQADRFGLGQIALDYIGFGTSFFDFDNDGKTDIYVANGSTFQQRDNKHLLIPMKDQVFWNRNAKEGFYDVSKVSGEYFSKEYVGRGSAHADYDNDGDLDMFIVNNNGPGVLLRNDGGNNKAWLKVKLTGKESNSRAIGARIRVVTGQHVQIKIAGTQGSYLSQHSSVEHFGLGTSQQIDTLEITWPSSHKQYFYGLPVNQYLNLTEGGEIKGLSMGKQDIKSFWETYRKATSLRMAGNYTEAVVNYEKALTLNNAHEDAIYYLGNMYLELKEYKKAQQTWEKLVTTNPNSARAHYQLGNLYFLYKDSDYFNLPKAAVEFKKTIAINKDFLQPLLYLGQIALFEGQDEEAQQNLSLVLVSNEKNTEAHLLNGYIAWKKGNADKARSSFSLAISNTATKAPTKGIPGEGDTRAGVSLERSLNRSPFFSFTQKLSDTGLDSLDIFYRDLDTFIKDYPISPH